MAKHTDTRSRSPLDRDLIVGTAIDIADRIGIDGLSMRKLAGELGVEAMSLYYHVPNKDVLLDLMVDRIIREIGLPSLDDPWKPAMRARAVSAHEVFQAHPWAIGITDSRTTRDIESLRYYDTMVGCLLRAGFSLPMAGHALSAIDAYVYGFNIQQLNLPLDDTDQVGDVSEALLAQMPPDEFPHLTRMILDHVMQPGYDYAAEFEWGLDLVLDGLEQRFAASEAGEQTQPPVRT